MKKNEVCEIIEQSFDPLGFDALSYALIDFNKMSFESATWLSGLKTDEKVTFDLASLTKPLTLAAYFHLNPQKLTSDFRLLLEHRGGLPSWGRLDQKTWRAQLLNYDISESEACYSDFGALRLMLEIEKKESLYESVKSFYDDELYFWKDLTLNDVIPATGYRKGERIIGEVNDDNCFVLNQFCSHAGLFSTVEGLSRTLLNLFKKVDIFGHMKKDYSHRFQLGWDQARGEHSLAGQGFSKGTFGHLGFTGTSLWIDPVTKKGWVLLTNATKEYWHHRSNLNELRRELGKISWVC